VSEEQASQDSRLKGWTLAYEGQHEAAVALLREAAGKDPLDHEILNLLGKSYYHLGRKREASACWRQVLSQDPGNAVAYSCLHQATSWLGRYILAGFLAGWIGVMLGGWFVYHLTFQEISKISETPDLLFSSVESSVGTEAIFTPTVSPLPMVSPTPMWKATPVEPKQVAQEEKGIEDPFVIYREALAAFHQYDVDRCKEILSRLEAMDLPLELKDNVLFWQGECLYVQGRYERARQYFERVLRETPQGSKALEAELMIAFCQAKTGPVEEAYEVLRASLERDDVPERLKDAARRCLGKRVLSSE